MTFPEEQNLREQILALSAIYTKKRLKGYQFIPGETYIPASGATMDRDDVGSLVECSLKGWITEGEYARQFSRDLRQFLDNKIRFAVLTNSGSSANLLAVTAVCQPEFGSRQVRKGQEFITAAVGFPTTLSSMVQNGIVPVFVDIDPHTLTPDYDLIEQNITEKTKGVLLAHTLGSPFDVDTVRDICNEYDVWMIEDCCDALGSRFNGELVGTQANLSTCSFFPAHHVTTGQGGAVFTDSPMLKKVLDSLRAWGRDCWCLPGKDNTCGKRHQWCMPPLPEGYDHKYIFSRMGYNLQITDLQAALGVAQVKKLKDFEQKRKYNWRRLSDAMEKYSKFFLLPRALPGADPSWFGFHLSVREVAPFKRKDIVAFLEERKIGTRFLFGGNMLSQPAFKNIPHKTVGELHNSNILTRACFWVGVHQGIGDAQLDYMIDTIEEFLKPYA